MYHYVERILILCAMQAAGRAAEKNLKDLKPRDAILSDDQKADIEQQKAALNKFLEKHNPNKGST